MNSKKVGMYLDEKSGIKRTVFANGHGAFWFYKGSKLELIDHEDENFEWASND